MNCLFVISLQKLMPKLSVRVPFQDQLVCYFLCVKIWLSRNLSQMPILIWILNLWPKHRPNVFVHFFLLASSGIVPDSLAKRHPGNMSNARWLTTANRLLRLYVATESRDKNLLLLVNFILKLYAEMWFGRKCIPQVQKSLVHLFLMLNALKISTTFLWLGTSRYCANVLKFSNDVQSSANL